MASDRAKQFMPFASLRGYGDMVKEQSRPREVRRELDDDEILLIEERLARLKKHMTVTVTYYDTDHYETLRGPLTLIDTVMRTLRVSQKYIAFEDLAEIEF